MLEHVLKHPATSVSEVHAGTGFAQSHVSVTVARLHELAGLLLPPGD